MPTTRRHRLCERRPEGLSALERYVLELGTVGALEAGHDPIEALRVKRQHAARLWAEWGVLIMADWRNARRPGLPWAAERFAGRDGEDPA